MNWNYLFSIDGGVRVLIKKPLNFVMFYFLVSKNATEDI